MGAQPRGLSAEELVTRWRYLPAVDPAALRHDIDAIVDMTVIPASELPPATL